MDAVAGSPRRWPGPKSGARAKPFLDALYAAGHRPEMIGRDPLRWPRMFEARADREVAAFLAASLAYGNVAQIDRSLGDLFRRMGGSPAEFARRFAPGKSDAALEGFYHRFNDARDLRALVHALGQMLRGWGSIEGFWAWANRAGEGETIAERAGRFFEAARALDLSPYFPAGAPRPGAAPRSSFLYLLPNAGGPSACKRIHMFLRWVVRPEDGIDLGLWSVERPAALEYPVDTHIHRLAINLGATARKAADARARREITAFFRRCAPEDPVRYDFSLCRLGILRHCPRKSDLAMCERCDLRPACRRHSQMARAR